MDGLGGSAPPSCWKQSWQTVCPHGSATTGDTASRHTGQSWPTNTSSPQWLFAGRFRHVGQACIRREAVNSSRFLCKLLFRAPPSWAEYAALRTRVAPGPKAAGGRNWPVTGRPTAADGIREGWPTGAGRPARHARAQTRMHKGARQVSADAHGARCSPPPRCQSGRFGLCTGPVGRAANRSCNAPAAADHAVCAAPRNAAHPHAIVDPARLAQAPDTLERAPPPPRVLPWSAYRSRLSLASLSRSAWAGAGRDAAHSP